jgi:diacylglycerol kinase (ATP)
MTRRVLVVVNPVSGRRRAGRDLPRFLAAFRGAGGTAEEFRTAAAGDAARAAAGAAADGFDAVVAVGGDGTVNEILNGLGDARLPVGLLPSGTANLLARDLGIPFDAAAAGRVAATGRAAPVDLGLARAAGVPPRRFLCVAGAGLDGAVVRAVASSRETGPLGFRGWIGPLWRTLRAYDYPVMEASVDGAPAGRGTLAVVCNTRSYGGLFTLAAGARTDDGLLDLCLVDAGRGRPVAPYLWAAWRGTLAGRPGVTIAPGARMRIDAPTAVPVQVDGDPCGTTPLEVEVLPGAARVIVPA